MFSDFGRPVFKDLTEIRAANSQIYTLSLQMILMTRNKIFEKERKFI